MSEWWTYSLEDFLLFAPRTYWRMFELHNAALWPLHLIMGAAGLAVTVLVLRRSPNARLWTGLVLGAVWAFVAWSFLMARYAPINWAIAYAVPAFFLQAALLLVAAGLPRGLIFGRRDATAWIGLMLAVAGLLAYPCLPFAFGRPWSEAEVFGVAADPTAIVTLGLLLAGGGPMMAALLPIPLLWCAFSGLTLYAMDDGQAWLPVIAVAVSLAAVFNRLGWRPPPPAPA